MKTVHLTDAEALSLLLPFTYKVEDRENSVYCHTIVGVSDPYWDILFSRIQTVFQDRLLEVNHQVCTDHSSFTVHFKPVIMSKDKLTVDMEDFLTGILNSVWAHNINPSDAYDEICELFGVSAERHPL